jgi:hypothetical protein
MAGKSTISITFKLDGDAKGFKDLAKDAGGLKKVITATVSEAEKLNKTAINFAAIATGVDQAQRAIQSLQDAVKSLSKDWADQVQAETQLKTVMRQRMAATDKEIQSIIDLASAQQQLGVIGDEVQLAGAQQVATFLTSKRSIETLLPAMNNLLAQQKGLAATSQDAVNIANLMGKAMQGQTAALRRVGITFDAAQDNVLKYGTESQRAAMLAQVITDNVGNMNAELAKTDIGKQKQLENNLGEIKEKLGEIAQSAMPFVTLAASSLIALGGIVKLLAGIKAATVAVMAWDLKSKLASATMVLLGVRTGQTAAVTRVFSAAMTTGAYSATAFKLALRGLMIGTAVGAAIVAVTWAVEALINKMDDADGSTDKFLDAEERAKQDAEDVKQAREAEAAALTQTHAALDINIQKLKDFKGTKEQEKKIVEEMNNTYGDTMGYFDSVAKWYNALIKNSEAYCQQMVVEARTRMLANQIARKEQETHDLMYDENGKKRMYSKQRKTKRVAHVDTSGASYAEPEVSYSTEEIAGTSDWEKATAAVIANNRAVANLRKQMQGVVEDAKKIKFAVQGSGTRPTGGGGGGSNTEKEKTRLQELNTLIDQAKEKYVNASEEEQQQIQKNIAGWKAEKNFIELMQRQAERPAVLNSLQAIDDEISYQQALRKVANKEALAGIDKEIDRLNGLRREMENTHVPVPVEQIGTYEQLNRELQYYTELLQNADAEARVSIQSQINKLNDLKKSWDDVLADLKKPGDISTLDNINKLDEAISYYQAKQREQTAAEITNTQKVIDALEAKREAMNRGIKLAAINKDIAKIDGLQGGEFKVKVRSIGFDELTDRIREMQDLLNDTDNPVSDDQRKEIESIIETYERWRKASINAFDTMKSGWNGIKGIGGGIESITSALEGNGNAWQTVTGIVDGFIQLYEGIQTIVGIIDLLTTATTAHAVAKTAEGAATTVTMGATTAAAATEEAATAAVIPVIIANKAATASYMELAAAMFFAAHAAIPFAGFGIAAGFTAAATAMVQAIGVMPFAKGAVVSGPTLALVGEYAGAGNNPEVIAPLDKLRSMIEPAGDMSGKVEFEIKGRSLVGLLLKENNHTKRS